jgi:hypothetical protein
MLRMFLEFDSFIFDPIPKRPSRIRVTKMIQDALEPALQRFLEIRFAYLDTPTSPLKAKPMTHKNPKKRAIFLRLPESLVDRLDTVVSDLQMPSRSYYLRRSIERALDFSEAREIPLFNDLNALGNPLR